MLLKKFSMTSSHKLTAYIKLMRLDKPIGTLLLLWPTLSALFLAGWNSSRLDILVVFILGVVVMRSAGCVINDFADREFDGHVERTQHRPLPLKQVSGQEAKLLFAVLILIAFLLTVTLNRLTISLSFFALGLAWIYPFLKRVTFLPQLGLGLAFSWSIPMAYAAVSNHLSLQCWLLFLINILWTIAYDTQYAMVDRDDDLLLKVKSTAILFGKYDIAIISMIQTITCLLLIILGYICHLSQLYYVGVGLILLLFIYQFTLLKKRKREDYFRAFKNNNYVGMILFIAISGSIYLMK